jgi:hypothetical protein
MLWAKKGAAIAAPFKQIVFILAFVPACVGRRQRIGIST